ncbi:MAG TPA: lysophospholipid acyltransferase family protein [Rhizomicrobium sp.]|jgi:putative hemolysin|nr:lysophospholipid acyltransferase family protein [Rhizomicrobium sp.]
MSSSGEAIDTFSYADPSDPWFKKLVIRAIERTTGQPYLKWIYEDNRAHPQQGETFWDAAVRRLELNLVYNKEMLATWPKTGPLVVIANHPFGVLDGLVISHLVSTVRSDFRVLTNAVLLRAEEARPWLFPVDFAETEEALQTNLKSRAESKKHLQNGGCLVVFPAGGVSTTPKILDKTATDTAWGTLTARLISQAKAPVAPVYFAGQNSRLFQIASHVSATLRLSLLFKEVHDRIGTSVVMRLGDVIPYERLAKITDRTEFMNHLRDATYALGQYAPNASKKRAKRPPRKAPGSRY